MTHKASFSSMIPKIEASFLRLDTSSGESDSSYEGGYRGRFASFSSDSQYPERSESSSPFHDILYNEGENKLKDQLKKFENCLYDDGPFDGLPQPLVKEAEVWKSYALHIRVVGKKIELKRKPEEETKSLPVYTEQDLLRDFPEHDILEERLYLENLEGSQIESKMADEPVEPDEVLQKTEPSSAKEEDITELGYEEIIEKHGEYEDVVEPAKKKGFTPEEKVKLSEDIKKEVLQRLLQGIWPSIMEKADPILKLTHEKKMKRAKELKEVEVIKPTSVYCLPAPPKELLGRNFSVVEKPAPLSCAEREIEKATPKEVLRPSPRYLSHTAQPVSRRPPIVQSSRNHSSLSGRANSEKDSLDSMRRELRATLLRNERIMKSSPSCVLPPIDLSNRIEFSRTSSRQKLPPSRSSSMATSKTPSLKKTPAPAHRSTVKKKDTSLKLKEELLDSSVISVTSIPPPAPRVARRNLSKGNFLLK